MPQRALGRPTGCSIPAENTEPADYPPALVILNPVVLSHELCLLVTEYWRLQVTHGQLESLPQSNGGRVTIRYHDHSPRLIFEGQVAANGRGEKNRVIIVVQRISGENNLCRPPDVWWPG